MTVFSAKLTKKPAKAVFVLAVWALLVQSTLACCAPVAAMPVEKAAQAGTGPHCHNDHQPAPGETERDARPACCSSPVTASNSHFSTQPPGPAKTAEPDLSVSAPQSLFIASPPLTERRPPPARQPVRRSRPYYLSYCVFLE